MKSAIKILILASIVMMLAVSACGCVSETNPSPTVAPTAAPTAAPVTVHKVAPTPKPTAKPKPTVDTSVPSDVQSVCDAMVGQGYTVVTPVAYFKTDVNGDKMYTVTFSKGAYVFATEIIVTSSDATAQQDLTTYVEAAQSLGFTGSYTTVRGYSTAWEGFSTSSSGAPQAYIVGVLSANSWVVMMVAE